MSEDLRRQLQILEDDYAGQPLIVQRADLREINLIRTQLGMPLVDVHLNEIGNTAVKQEARPTPEEAKPCLKETPDLTEARTIYQAYLKKIAELEVHRAYAEQVVAATAGIGQTPVRPLATMGTNGGPLRCDRCGKPIVLEGGRFHGMTADVAWQQNPRDWNSWILGGMVVESETNGTLRIYHGYPGGKNDCCAIADREDKNERAKFESGKGFEKEDLIRVFLEQEFPDLTREEEILDLLDKILQTLYSYDPGIGINRPSRES